MKSKKISFIFPGQGTQYIGMGCEIIDQFPTASRLVEEAETFLGTHLLRLIKEGPEKELTETKNSQVAIYVVSVAILKVLNELFPDMQPSFTAGLSLGEYTALHASGKVSFLDGLEVVSRRGAAMNEACLKYPGTMAVVLGLSPDQVIEAVKRSNLPEDLWTANFNCPGQIVISGTARGIEIGSKTLLDMGAKRVLPIQVHGAFHSGLMRSAQESLRPVLEELKLQETAIQLVMNVNGKVEQSLPKIRDNLIKQVTHSVLWEQSIRTMEQELGTDLFVSIGPSTALVGLNKRIEVQAPTLSIDKLADLENLHKILG